MNTKGVEDGQFERGDRVYHTQNGETIESYFDHYCKDSSKAVVADGDRWGTGYEVVKVVELRREK